MAREHELCAAHEALDKRLENIESGVKSIDAKLGSGDVTFENLKVRMDHVEKVVYGALAAAGLALLAAIVSLVLK